MAREIERLLKECPTVARGHVGYKFVDVETGEVLAEKDALTFFTPASNTKLYTTSAALVRLGPNYKFQTEVTTRTKWQPGQTTVRDLEIIGGGDPNLSSRVLPYTPQPPPADQQPASIPALTELAEKIAATGIRVIDGDVTGLSTRYTGDRYPNGWTVEDTIFGYGAPVTALALNDNAVSVIVRPAGEGELASIDLRPVSSYFVILNEVVTDDSKDTGIHVFRAAGSNELVLTGSIAKTAGEWRQDIAIDDPALFGAESLIDLLRAHGVSVRGVARSEYRDIAAGDQEISLPQTDTGTTVLAVHDSAPLWQALQVVNKVSQNLHAEMFLREIGFVTRGSGTLQAGREEREAFLEEAGVTPEGTGFALVDGSGLARQDITTPDSTVALLRYMWQRPEHDYWLASLPVGGRDGTLQHRFEHVANAARVHAKTGSLAHVSALSGYIDAGQHWIAFSIMINATAGHEAEVHQFIDELCAIFIPE